jgi:hypothetical protein
MPCLQWNRQKKECRKRGEVIEYSNSEISKVIDEYIHNQKYRDLMKRRYIDGILQETLAEEFNMSVRQVQNIIYKNENIIFKHLK